MKFKAWKIIILTFIVLIVAVLAFGPMVAVNQLEKNSKEWVGRKLDIGDLSLNYFTGTLTITQFTMYEADDKTTFIAFDTLLINTEPYHLFSNELVVEEVGISGLRTYITRRDPVFNFDDLIAFYSQTDSLNVEEEPVDTTLQKDPMVIKISNIHLNAKELSYTALILEHETRLVNLNLIVPYISLNAEGGSHAGVQFDLADNGHFGIKLDFNPDSSDFHADIKIDELNLANYYVYAEYELNISALKGMFATHLIFDGNLNEIEKTLVKGNINLKDFALHDTKEQKLVGLENLIIGIAKIDNYNQRYIIDSVRLSRPFVNLELLDEGTNFDNLLKVREDTTIKVVVKKEVADTIPPRAKDLYYSVRSFIIDDAVIEFKDHTTPKLFTYHLSAINMLAKDITSDAEWVKTHLDMLLNNRGKMKVEFGFNPMKPMDMDVDYVLTNFQLSDINIYSEMNTGYPFVYGEMFYYSDTKIRDGKIVSENKLRINDVELGEKVKGWKSIPIKFALFLLKDKNGDVVMDVPVRGDLNDPEINIKKLAWTTFKKAIFKVASSPVDFLAGFAKIDPNDIKTVEFAYLDTTLSNHVQHQLDMLIKLEEAKPGLKIKMAYVNDVKKEKALISVNEVGKEFNVVNKSDFTKKDEEFVAYIKAQTLKDSIDIETDCMLLVGQYKVDSLYQNYSTKRIEKINNYLHSKNDSTQIRIEPLHRSLPKNIGSIPMFEMKYSVEDE
ncbi:MAG: DUF748 domain-containing protein [Bacteroidales bacterium]|nr:DUF748 domain-containing protein [Bacteroidales bacterium]